LVQAKQMLQRLQSGLGDALKAIKTQVEKVTALEPEDFGVFKITPRIFGARTADACLQQVVELGFVLLQSWGFPTRRSLTSAA
jgi:hypothetical protein